MQKARICHVSPERLIFVARIIHPFSRTRYPAGAIYKQGCGSSIVEVIRFELPSFTMDIQERKWFGLELCRMIVDACLVSQRAGPSAQQSTP
jgi:hypothetical protein